ncbi:MAG: hypothetical protein HC774_07850, partial [Sphingomonadales bacterium]|nr:hypothetical protein [Sphingomonadales bacterium]
MVLTAGADIRAVERDEGYGGERYRVRSELREYLSSVVDRHLKRDKSLAVKARIEQVIAASLRPMVLEHADIVIGHLHPMKPVDGFTSTVSLAALQATGHLPDAYDARVIRRVMNAGATVDMAAPDKIPRDRLAGTVQNDVLKEYIARGTYIYPVEPSLRLVTDIFAFCAAEVPRWNTISISGYHMREAGSTAAQEVAFTFANALEYVERAVARGLDMETFAPRLSFFF